MKKIIAFVFLFLSAWANAQNEQLAQNYYDRGEFEKALVSYEELLKNQTGNTAYFQRVVECYQQLQQFDKAEKALQGRLDKYKQSNLLVELGYNYQLQKEDSKAKKLYEQAIDRIKKNANEAYGIAYAFERKSLIDYALLAYKTATEIEPRINFNFQMAVLYGQKGETDLMVETYLLEGYQNPQNLPMIQNQLSRFMNEDADLNFNDNLRKALLVRAQKSQDIFWNEFLSWFFIQQKEYGKAFVQQKAIYKREPESFTNIVNLAQMAIEDNEQDVAKEILTFVLENTNDLDLLIQAHSYITEMKIENSTEKEYAAITEELDKLIKEFGVSPYSLPLLRLQAKFSAFYLKKPEQAKAILKNALEMELNRYQTAEIKMELADSRLF